MDAIRAIGYACAVSSGKAKTVRVNPLLLTTEAPPIPAAKAWAEAYDGAHGKLIDLSQAVPGYPPHPEFLKRLGDAAAMREAASYGDILGDRALRSAYAGHVSGLYGASISAENVAITAGCNQAFVVAIMALAKAGDAVLLPSPWYFNHKMALDMLGIEAIALPCRPERGFVPDADEARGLLTGRARAIVLVSPNNPTGAIYPREAIAAFYRLAQERGIVLVLDETYRDFIADEAPPHDCFADPNWQGTLVQLYSFSKSYCIPGHRTGALIASEKILGEIAKVLDTLQICAPRVAQIALPWAISALVDWRAANRTEIERRVTAFKAAIAEASGWRIGSIGAYFAFVAHPFQGESDVDVCARLAGERGVLMLPGSFFGPGENGYLRAAFANVGTAEIAEIGTRLADTRGMAWDNTAAHSPRRHART